MTASIEQAIRMRISRERCPVHHKHPKITFTNKGFELECCCESFHRALVPKIEKIVGDAMGEEIERQLNRLL